MWRVVPCASRKSLRTDSRKDTEEILKTKLATIKEEPENEQNLTPPRHRRMAKKGKKIRFKDKMGGSLISLKDSYALFMTGFASKGSFGGLLQY